MLTDRSEYIWAIGAIGAALVALFIAAAATGAAGNTIPTELWAAGGVLGGGLVGVLVPAPAGSQAAASGSATIHAAAVSAAADKAKEIADSNPDQKAAATAALRDVVAAAKQPPTHVRRGPAIDEAIARHKSALATAGGDTDADVKRAAADAASDGKTAAATDARLTGLISVLRDILKIAVPAIVFGIALYFGIKMSDGSIGNTHCDVGVIKANTSEAPCATALFQTANALITLASTAAGALVGLFAPTPGKSS